MKHLVSEEVKAHFRPELLNRFDQQVVFNKLSLKDARRVLALMLADTRQRVSALGYTLEVAEPMVDKIISEGYSDEYGVRRLRQVAHAKAQALTKHVFRRDLQV